jgi:serine/threonine protein kinase
LACGSGGPAVANDRARGAARQILVTAEGIHCLRLPETAADADTFGVQGGKDALRAIRDGYEADGLRVRISDFGLAKHANPLNLLLIAWGPRRLKSPAAFRDFSGDSTAGDVWTVAVTLYLLRTDRLPREHSTLPRERHLLRRTTSPEEVLGETYDSRCFACQCLRVVSQLVCEKPWIVPG